MNIREADLLQIKSLSSILKKEESEIVHMAISLLSLKIELPFENKELAIYHKNDGKVTGLIYGIDSE